MSAYPRPHVSFSLHRPISPSPFRPFTLSPLTLSPHLPSPFRPISHSPFCFTRFEARNVTQLLVQTPLFCADLFRDHDFQSDVFIASSTFSLVSTLATQTQSLTALRSRVDSHLN